ncbi:hypothetical protein BH11ACT3_BH11ACT3_12940 [soil metagenome]
MRSAIDSEAGAGAVLALAIVGAVVLIGLAAMSFGAAMTVRQATIGAADAAALAAADGASGAVSGDPCRLAAQVAAADGAALASCRLDGLVATIGVAARFGPFPVRALSTAGPPP